MYVCRSVGHFFRMRPWLDDFENFKFKTTIPKTPKFVPKYGFFSRKPQTH